MTSAIIGPRTIEQLDDPAARDRLVLSDEVLDAIDAIVPPGTTIRDDDAGYAPPALTEPALRRR